MEEKGKYSIKSDVISTEMDGEIVLMDVAHGEYYSLNEVGSLIWKKMEESPLSFDDVCNAVMAEYEVDRTHCEKDVTALLDHMLEKSVIERSE